MLENDHAVYNRYSRNAVYTRKWRLVKCIFIALHVALNQKGALATTHREQQFSRREIATSNSRHRWLRPVSIV
jgi:hypothetical protein